MLQQSGYAQQDVCKRAANHQVILLLITRAHLSVTITVSSSKWDSEGKRDLSGSERERQADTLARGQS